MLPIHIAIWIHDHSLDASDPQVEDIECWAQYIQVDSGDLCGPDGHWLVTAHNLDTTLITHKRIHCDVVTSFQYPPWVLSAFARHWESATEWAIDCVHMQLKLECVWFDIISADEDVDMTDVTLGNSTNPGNLPQDGYGSLQQVPWGSYFIPLFLNAAGWASPILISLFSPSITLLYWVQHLIYTYFLHWSHQDPPRGGEWNGWDYPPSVL